MGSSWLWSYGSWIYNYLCNQCLSPLMLWVLFSIRARCTTLCDKVCQWLATSPWFSPGPPVSTTNKTNRHDNIVESGVKHHQTNNIKTRERAKQTHMYIDIYFKNVLTWKNEQQSKYWPNGKKISHNKSMANIYFEKHYVLL